MCRFVLFVITGSVMMNRISNTSMTSTSGVVFMSAMGPESSFAPMLMAMGFSLLARTPKGCDWPASVSVPGALALPPDPWLDAVLQG